MTMTNAGQGTRATPRRAASTETRRSVFTTEFWVAAVSSIWILIAGLLDDEFDVAHAWTLFTAITVAYLLSRGIAKAGSREEGVPASDVDLR